MCVWQRWQARCEPLVELGIRPDYMLRHRVRDIHKAAFAIKEAGWAASRAAYEAREVTRRARTEQLRKETEAARKAHRQAALQALHEALGVAGDSVSTTLPYLI